MDAIIDRSFAILMLYGSAVLICVWAFLVLATGSLMADNWRKHRALARGQRANRDLRRQLKDCAAETRNVIDENTELRRLLAQCQALIVAMQVEADADVARLRTDAEVTASDVLGEEAG